MCASSNAWDNIGEWFQIVSLGRTLRTQITRFVVFVRSQQRHAYFYEAGFFRESISNGRQ